MKLILDSDYIYDLGIKHQEILVNFMLKKDIITDLKTVGKVGNKLNLPRKHLMSETVGVGAYFNKDGEYVLRRPEDNFYFIIDRIQTDKGLKLNDIASKTGVSVKTLYNIQKEYREPGEGHTTTIAVIKKVFTKFPQYRKDWEEYKSAMPVEKKDEVLENLIYDRDLYVQIPMLGNWYSLYNDPSISSLEPNQIPTMLLPKFIAALSSNKVEELGSNWYGLYSSSIRYTGVSIVGALGDCYPGTKIYKASLNNWTIVKFKDQRKYYRGLIYCAMTATDKDQCDKPNCVCVDLHFVQNGNSPGDQSITSDVVRNVDINDIEYTLPFVTTVSQATLDSWLINMKTKTKTKKDESEAKK